MKIRMMLGLAIALMMAATLQMTHGRPAGVTIVQTSQSTWRGFPPCCPT